MVTRTRQLELGASMYVPLTYPIETIIAIANGAKYPNLRSVIFDTEDSVLENQVAQAMSNLKEALPHFRADVRIKRFVRVRTPYILGRVTSFYGVENLIGFVLPKITSDNLGHYLSNLSDRDSFMLMPTLETAETFDKNEMIRLRNKLIEDSHTHQRILCLRIGGNDLLSCLRIRRNPRYTIYDTGIGPVIAMLAGIFIPYGIGLAAPVCEVMGDPAILANELEKDLDHGLFGKTAIHPSQIESIEAAYVVSRSDYNEALQILDVNAPAVFRAKIQDGDDSSASTTKAMRMSEPATHHNWAVDTVARAELYGIRDVNQLVSMISSDDRQSDNVVSLHYQGSDLSFPNAVASY